MSPAMTEPPMPRVTMRSNFVASGSADPGTLPAASCAAASCSGMALSASPSPNESTAIATRLRGEGRLDAVRRGLGLEARRLGVVDRLGLVDQHDRDVVAHCVAALQTRVVEARLVLEVEQRPLVLRAREDLQKLRVQRHRHSSGVVRGAVTTWRARARAPR